MSLIPKLSPLGAALLALLIEAPMHPYRMQSLIKQRGKDRVINVGQRASLYKTINRLYRDGLIRVRETERTTQHPERTVYEITNAGREAVLVWMREILSTPRREYPQFPAGIAYLPLLATSDAVEQLTKRSAALTEQLATLDSEIANYDDIMPRLFILELEYLRAMSKTELDWVGELVDDLRSGRIYWDSDWLDSILNALGDNESAGSARSASDQNSTATHPHG